MWPRYKRMPPTPNAIRPLAIACTGLWSLGRMNLSLGMECKRVTIVRKPQAVKLGSNSPTIPPEQDQCPPHDQKCRIQGPSHLKARSAGTCPTSHPAAQLSR